MDTLGQLFAFKDRANFFKLGPDVFLRESNLSEPMDVGKLLATILDKNDSAAKSDSSLKQSNFMNDVFSGSHLPVGLFILSGHN